MLLLIKAFELLNSGLGILIFHIPLIHQNVVYKCAYKQVQNIFLQLYLSRLQHCGPIYLCTLEERPVHV